MWKMNRSACIKCGSCISACPNAALEMTKFGILCNKKLCNSCGKCANVCPTHAIKVE